MKRRRQYSQPRLGRDAERLAWLAEGLVDSGSRAEDAFWEGELRALITKLLDNDNEEPMNQALDRLHETNVRAYEELADLIEGVVEGGHLDERQFLLIALPILAWSRYEIPAKSLAPETISALRAQLSGHVLADGARLALADFLYSPEQLPRGFLETRALARELGATAIAGQDARVDAKTMPESALYVSDVRYILGAIAVEPSKPLFRWNETDGNRDEAEKSWRAQGGPNLQSTLLGCAYELVLPDAYFAAWRRADRDGRAFSLTSAVAYLQSLLEAPAADFWAAVAPYYDQRLREWRIGFGRKDDDRVLHGVVWPLLGAEDESADIGAEIAQILKGTRIGQVQLLDQRMPLEYCEDCGAPLFPNLDGEPTHTEEPEPVGDGAPMHLH
jgi:hypothetical protein